MKMNGDKKCLDQLKELAGLRALILKNETKATYEAVGIRISMNADEMFFQYADHIDFPGFSYSDAVQFVDDICKGKDVVVGPYISSYYKQAFDRVQLIGKDLYAGGYDFESRRLVVDFPREHCFQNVQFLFRKNTLIVIANMRSCNYEENFMMDLFLCYSLGRILLNCCRCISFPIFIIMNIGSLHIFK